VKKSRAVVVNTPNQSMWYRIMTSVVREYDLESVTHLRWLILSDEPYEGNYFDWAPENSEEDS